MYHHQCIIKCLFLFTGKRRPQLDRHRFTACVWKDQNTAHIPTYNAVQRCSIQLSRLKSIKNSCCVFMIHMSASFSRGRTPVLPTAISAGICCILDQIRNPCSRNLSAYQASHHPFSYCFLHQLTDVFPSFHPIPSVLLISCLIGQQQDKKRKEKVKNACDHSLLRPLSRSLMWMFRVCVTLLWVFANWSWSSP